MSDTPNNFQTMYLRIGLQRCLQDAKDHLHSFGRHGEAEQVRLSWEFTANIVSYLQGMCETLSNNN